MMMMMIDVRQVIKLSHIIIIIIIMCWSLVWKFSVGENDDD
jgi:uncharacterized membrane protein